MNMPISSKPASRMPGLPKPPVLKVLGLGGGGCNAISRMIELGLSSVEYIAANTDAQTLKTCLAPTKIQLGPRLTRGLGAGGDPNVGQAAAEESYADLNRALTGADMVFLTAGMGGGTGTGSIPIAARVARNLGAVTIAIVTMPFSFEVGRRQKNAREGLAQLRQYTDTLITVPNDRLLQIAEKNLPLELTFRMADDVLRQGIMGITELITQPGLINVDFAHVRQIMQLGGGSLLAIGTASGPGKAIQAVERALHHPLIESINLENATGIIANFTAGQDLTFMEVADALTFLQSKTTNQADIIPGIIVNDSMGDKVQVILVITGLGATPIDDKPSNPSQPVQKHMEIASEHEVSSHHLLHPEPEPKPQPMAPKSQVEMIASPVDLDVPAFIRRRLR